MRLLSVKKNFSVLVYALINRIKSEAVYPFYASFKLNNVCGFRCSFCDIWKEEPKEPLPIERIYRILDNLANSSIIVVSFEGGEPLLRKGLLKILKYASRLPLYTEITTSARNLIKYPLEQYFKYLDFFHISIDEGHDNLHLFQHLEEFRSSDAVLGVQIVVTRQTLGNLKEKIRHCYKAGAKAVIMPAAHLNRLEDVYPDPSVFRDEVLRLKKIFPHTIVTFDLFLNNINKTHSCAASSIVIDSDGKLYYPCHLLKFKRIDLAGDSLMEFLKSNQARKDRKQMAACERRCGWYQYFAVPPYLTFSNLWSVLKEYYFELFNIRTIHR